MKYKIELFKKKKEVFVGIVSDLCNITTSNIWMTLPIYYKCQQFDDTTNSYDKTLVGWQYQTFEKLINS